MKLSEIKGERCFEVIADLVVPISNIAQDKQAAALFKRKAVPKGKNATEFFIERLKTGLPALLKNHANDFTAIMATLNNVPVDEYIRELNLAKLFGDVIGLLTDEEFLGFLS